MPDYKVSFSISHSSLSFEQFVDWVLNISPCMEDLVVDKHDRTFWQQSRRCGCGSQFFRNSSNFKVKCSQCGKEFDVV